MFQDSFLITAPTNATAATGTRRDSIMGKIVKDGSGNYELIQFGVEVEENLDIVYLELMSHMYLLQEIVERLRKVITLHILMIILYRKAQ